MIFELENITFSFLPENILFNNLLLIKLEQGKIYALMGGNGAGKTTLFNLIKGFHKVKTGNITFKNHDITCLPAYKINRIGILSRPAPVCQTQYQSSPCPNIQPTTGSKQYSLLHSTKTKYCN